MQLNQISGVSLPRDVPLSVIALLCFTLFFSSHAQSAPNTLNQQFIKAVRTGNSALTETLLRKGANPNLRLTDEEPDVIFSTGGTLLHVTARKDMTPLSQRCFLRGANPKAKNEAVSDPSHDCGLVGIATQFSEGLLAAGAQPLAVDNDGSSVLHMAACMTMKRQCVLLLARKANPMQKTKASTSPLIGAIVQVSQRCFLPRCQYQGAQPGW
jgi:ankyrin repeat protein